MRRYYTDRPLLLLGSHRVDFGAGRSAHYAAAGACYPHARCNFYTRTGANQSGSGVHSSACANLNAYPGANPHPSLPHQRALGYSHAGADHG